MAINKRKVLEAARRYASKGSRPKALREYGKLLAVDSTDVKLLLEVGDLYRRWGDNEEAIAHYSKVATCYREGGYDSRAIAVLKQIITLDPMRHTVRVALAEIYQKIGLSAEAVISLQQVADVYAQDGRERESLDLLRKMVGVDPANVQARVKVAELLERAGHSNEAVEEFRLAATEFKRRDEPESVVQMYERVLKISPKHVSTLVGIARELNKLGEAARAEPYVLRALDEEVKPEHYELACEVYTQLGDDDKLTAMNRSLAGLYRERGDEERAREVMQRSTGAPDLYGTGLGDEIVVEEAFEGAQPGSDSEVFDAAPAASAGLQESEAGGESEAASPAPGEADSGDSVFGEGFEIELGDDADPVASPEDAGADAFAFGELDLQEPGEASVSLGTDELDVGDLDSDLDVDLDLELDLDVDLGLDVDLDLDLDVDLGLDSDLDVDLDLNLDLDLGSDLESASGRDEGSDPGVDGELGEELTGADGGPGGAASARVDEDLEEAAFYLQQSMADEAAAVYRRVLEQVPGHPQATAHLAEIEGASQRTAVGQGEAESGASAPAIDLDTGGDAAAEIEIDLDLDADFSGDRERALETDFGTELDLDFDLGTDEDSGGALEIEIEIETDEPAEEGGADDSASLSPAQPGPEELFSADFDSISPAPGTQAKTIEDGVAELFADFKQGVSETLDQGDYQTRFDLGIAYREMELLEDAITEFRYCLDSPDWRLQSLQMIGLSSLDLGRASDAVSHFEQALSAPDLSDNQKAALCFDLGRAQAALGETDAAHDSFAKVRALDPNFAGLKEQVAGLPPRTPGTEPAEEQYESFDDLMAEFKDD
ncbi:MAG: hypothetical protein OSB70_13555 [Myxococcota bacterium]|nr:hypothetical protein [Myxococcota bacterium]